MGIDVREERRRLPRQLLQGCQGLQHLVRFLFEGMGNPRPHLCIIHLLGRAARHRKAEDKNKEAHASQWEHVQDRSHSWGHKAPAKNLEATPAACGAGESLRREAGQHASLGTWCGLAPRLVANNMWL